MSKFGCRCGHTIVDIESPCADLWLTIPDEQLWPLVKQLAEIAGKEHPTDHATAAICDAAIQLYRCPACERLLVFWNGSDEPYRSYVLEK